MGDMNSTEANLPKTCTKNLAISEDVICAWLKAINGPARKSKPNNGDIPCHIPGIFNNRTPVASISQPPTSAVL